VYGTLIAAWASAVLAGAAAQGDPTTPSGAALYKTYCASCHGTAGRGDGPVAERLRTPPPDLTRLMTSDGVFPAQRVRRIIDGRDLSGTHGRSDMPVWGDAFSRRITRAEAAQTEQKIDALVTYLESMQRRTGHAPE
jgi:mono/diheme cytochrome c family protein